MTLCEFNESNVTDLDMWGFDRAKAGRKYAGFADSDFDFRFMISMLPLDSTSSMVKVFGYGAPELFLETGNPSRDRS